MDRRSKSQATAQIVSRYVPACWPVELVVLLNTVARPVKRLIGKEKDQSPSPIDTGASDCSRSSGDLAIRVSVVSQRASAPEWLLLIGIISWYIGKIRS